MIRIGTLCTAIWNVFIITQITYSNHAQDFYEDRPFVQDSARKILLCEELAGARLSAVRCDRNGRVLVLSNKGLLQVSPARDGQAHDGKLVPDRQYRPLLDMEIRGLDTYNDQFVYLTDELVFSNAWAGRFLVRHGLPDGGLFQMGSGFGFLLAGKGSISLFSRGKCVDKFETAQPVKQLLFDPTRKRFLILAERQIACLVPGERIRKVFDGSNLNGLAMNCFELTDGGSALVIGTRDGYMKLDADSFGITLALQKKLPCTDIRCIKQIGDSLWFGTSSGAFHLNDDGRIDYYASKRWLVDDMVIDISKGPGDSVLILSQTGLSIIHFEPMTLQQKAEHFDKLTRERHIRHGLNSGLAMSKPGDLSTGTLTDNDNDGLWTAMYLAGELFRYSVTGSQEALQNCYESFEAMERLSTVNPIEGFPSRSFERTGYQVSDKSRWQPAEDPNWTWKATTSSDEIVGHFFAYTIFVEVVPDREWRDRAIALMDGIMDHIVQHDWYLIDFDGKPTLWGKWNPDYVNKFPKQVGDRRLNSAEVISFLQAAYHFTGKEIYKQKAFELMDKYGYLDNIMIPVSRLSVVPGIDLTTEWNHSDDELAFLSYWNLYKYAFTEELREKYRAAIKDHWEIERPEKNPLWNLIYAATRAADFDLEETIWSLKEFPLDTIGWSVRNSHRKDLEFLEPGFRHQTTRNVLPPDERPMSKYNGNAFRLDGGEGGHNEYSGDIYLLPYWLGRYLRIIR